MKCKNVKHQWNSRSVLDYVIHGDAHWCVELTSGQERDNKWMRQWTKWVAEIRAVKTFVIAQVVKWIPVDHQISPVIELSDTTGTWRERQFLQHCLPGSHPEGKVVHPKVRRPPQNEQAQAASGKKRRRSSVAPAQKSTFSVLIFLFEFNDGVAFWQKFLSCVMMMPRAFGWPHRRCITSKQHSIKWQRIAKKPWNRHFYLYLTAVESTNPSRCRRGHRRSGRFVNNKSLQTLPRLILEKCWTEGTSYTAMATIIMISNFDLCLALWVISAWLDLWRA